MTKPLHPTGAAKAPTTRELGKAIKEVRGFHAAGRKGLMRRPPRGVQAVAEPPEPLGTERPHLAADEAKELGVPVQWLKRARQFAARYTEAELEDLCVAAEKAGLPRVWPYRPAGESHTHARSAALGPASSRGTGRGRG